MWTVHARSEAVQLAFLIAAVCCCDVRAVEAAAQERMPEVRTQVRSAYVLGPEDQITIRVLDIEEMNDEPVLVASRGYIRLPLVGSIEAAGLTTQELEAKLVGRLKTYIRNPDVAVSVTVRRSHPVSVMGSVNTPGVFQLQGSPTLFEVLSMAGGLRADAGHIVRITRRREAGPIPLPGASEDSTS